MSQETGVTGSIHTQLRQREFEMAMELLDSRGLATIVLLRGETGSGKSALLRRVAEGAAERGYTLMSLAGFRAVANRTQPSTRLLIVIDDIDELHREEQHALLDEVRNFVSIPGVSIVGGGSRSSELDRVAHVIDLNPLIDDDVEKVMLAHGRSLSRTTLEHITLASGGNLSLILQYAAHKAAVYPELFPTTYPELPSRYQHLSAGYLALSEKQQAELLDLALNDVLRRIWGSHWAPATMLHPAADIGGFLSPDRRYHSQFASSLHRTAVLNSSTPAQYRAAHARRLVASETRISARTLHAAETGQGDPVELRHIVESLDARGALERATAVRLHLIADRPLKDQRAMVTDLLDEVALRGDFQYVREVGQSVVANTRIPVADEGPTALGLIRGLVDGELGTARVALERGLDDARQAKSQTDALIVALACVCLLQDDDSSWTAWLQQVNRARGVDPMGRILAREVGRYLGTGETGDWNDTRIEAGASPTVRTLYSTITCIIRALRKQRRGLRDLGSMETAAQRPGLPGMLARVILAELFLQHDEWRKALEMADSASDLAQRAGATVLAARARSTGILAKTLLGDITQAKADAFLLLADPQARRIPRIAVAAEHALALCLLTEGDKASARSVLEDQCSDCGVATSGPYDGAPLDLADALLNRGERPRQESGRKDLLRFRSGATVSNRRRFVTECAEALMTPDAEVLPRFVDDTKGTPYIYERARVRLILGERLRNDGEEQRSRTELLAAAADFQHLGASRWVDRANDSLQSRTSEPHRGNGAFSLIELTEQEMRIATLAASGLSNKDIGRRLYLSPRTVGGHLYNIFPKLNISSRAALRDALQPLVSSQNSDPSRNLVEPSGRPSSTLGG